MMYFSSATVVTICQNNIRMISSECNIVGRLKIIMRRNILGLDFNSSGSGRTCMKVLPAETLMLIRDRGLVSSGISMGQVDVLSGGLEAMECPSKNGIRSDLY
ncbi:hypothetical protein L195_g055517 [Trifolium pratense]|uniref:Uncharacterized protein n=1 Tax=Trifolium pratense TaxID=57577 RepID=A0A2K3KLS2_TRIPR|nr:hypothetical protein L195_g055517 [Trifolium pratense]